MSEPSDEIVKFPKEHQVEIPPSFNTPRSFDVGLFFDFRKSMAHADFLYRRDDFIVALAKALTGRYRTGKLLHKPFEKDSIEKL